MGEQKNEGREFGEESESLVRITAGPVLWAGHFVLSYAAAAIWCAKAAGPMGSILWFRIGVGALTLAVLASIAWLGWRAWRQWDYLHDDYRANDVSRAEDRHQFLGHAAFLLSLISFIGVVYVAMPVIFIETCR